MENKLVEIAKTEIENFGEKMISRKDAIKRTGYIAVSAATMMILLSQTGQANSPRASEPAPPPASNGNNSGGGGIWKKK